ncbi:hypothetical protein CAI16_14500 [Virgibacillus dokdonensis]|uniref:Uncharacterized protein n=1 Tax=Virgibacillus dokdonensis TaxID=302167 RepID=A0A3E0WMV6_9BACI|nr:hypothetical protein [Virgibacillus dokdonensis]RFA33481.1 hypothetical protein CAI16_14500 [Virgibacillus dokdonensis]
MASNLKEITGSLLSAIGTIQAAIGSTPQLSLSEDQRFQLRLIGNVLQALGSGVTADGETKASFEKLGYQIQATGNSTVIVGMLIYRSSDPITKEKWIITGLWMQALGSFLVASDEWADHTKGVWENTIGALLQGIGNSLQAISGIQTLRNNQSDQCIIGVVGSWIQAVGTVISFIGAFQEE